MLDLADGFFEVRAVFFDDLFEQTEGFLEFFDHCDILLFVTFVLRGDLLFISYYLP